MHGVHVKGLSEYYVSGASEVYEIIERGSSTRAVSATRMNTESSRSHSIFVYTIQQRSTETGTIKSGSLYLVDLAGSEKVGKTGASGQTLEEAKKINRSLSALGMVINALTDGKTQHVPYRDSKLTRILQESLGGNSRTTLIVNCSPVAYNAEETVSTLRFGVRAKAIKNNAHVNAELSPDELRAQLRRAHAQSHAHKRHIHALEHELRAWRSGQKVPDRDHVQLSGVAPPADGAVHGAVVDSAPEALRHEIAYWRAQESARAQRNQELAVELSEARLKAEELAAEVREQAQRLEERPASAAPRSPDGGAGAAPAAASLRQELAPQASAILSTLSALERGAAVPPADVRAASDAYLHAQIALSQETQRARTLERENAVLLEQQDAAAERSAALQRRFDLVTDRLGALEHGMRPGDEAGEHLGALRAALEEQTAALRGDDGELSRLQTLLSMRGEEAAALARSLEDLRASHAEQKQTVQLLTEAAGGAADAALVERLVHASDHMERSRELLALRLREYDGMKHDVMHELQHRSERMTQLQTALEELQGRYDTLAQAMHLRTQQKRMAVLEQHLEQLAEVQRELVEQNASLKRDAAVSERRLAARNERIQVLEEHLSEKQERITAQEGGRPASVEAGSDTLPSAPLEHANPFTFGRIAKPLRGGGGAAGGGPGLTPGVRGTAGNMSPPKPKGTWFFSAK